jgi:hypothetical protein
MNKLEELSNNKTYEVFRGLFKDVPDWSDFIENFNYNYNKGNTKQNKNPRFISDSILLYNKFDPVIFNCIENENTALFSKSLYAIQKIKELMGKDWAKDLISIKSIINFLGNEQGYWAHSDPHDVISWHCVGKVIYRMYESKDEDVHEKPIDITGRKFKEYILNPGDVVFIPSGVVHQVVVTEPRATLFFDRML